MIYELYKAVHVLRGGGGEEGGGGKGRGERGGGRGEGRGGGGERGGGERGGGKGGGDISSDPYIRAATQLRTRADKT